MLQSPFRMRLSTDQLPPGERVDIWHEVMTRRNMALEFVDHSENGLHFDVHVQQFGTVAAAFLRGTPASYLRTRRVLAADSRDYLTINIHTAGRFHVENSRGAADSGPGGAFVVSTRHEFAFHVRGEDCAGWAINVDRAPLEPLLAGLDEPLLVNLRADNPGLRLLTGYLETLQTLDAYDGTLASTHVGDLLLSALGVRGDVQALVRERGVSAARQSAILDHIAKHAADACLDPAHAAQQLGMSVRYLHRLLEPTGRSFAEHVLTRRLERAAEMLRDPAFAHLRIAEIATAAGFADISHFNRSFRRTHGDTPYSLRVRVARRKAN
jgi:AraC-like DNA-binding protein